MCKLEKGIDDVSMEPSPWGFPCICDRAMIALTRSASLDGLQERKRKKEKNEEEMKKRGKGKESGRGRGVGEGEDGNIFQGKV